MQLIWIIVLIGYAVGVAQSIFALTAKRPVLRKTAVVAMVVAFGTHTGWLFYESIKTGRCPLVGSQEIFSFLAWLLFLSYLIVQRWYRTGALNAFVLPIVLVLATIGAIAPDTPSHPGTPNPPLEAFLLPIHVGLILLSYAAFFIAFGAGLMYMIQERELRSKHFGRLFYRLPSLNSCDEISARSMAAGFALLTIGILAGFWYSHARFGVYWKGDPLEIFSVVTWVLYLILIQSRMKASWGGRTAAMASILSFVIVICSLVGVRYLGHA
ncbi:MAG TPA: cytochrome c biogenesis protein [Blastocatellia bacterium]|nr:cytochrome c biogenesis protein [Blastocatellia bacterium]